jgi:predicted permease
MLLATQVALCTLLVTASLVSVRGMIASLNTPLGFRPQGLAASGVALGLAGYNEEQGRQFHQRLLEEVAALPGVTAAAYSSSLPLSINQSSTSLFPEGDMEFRPADAIGATYYRVSPTYFAALGTALRTGRAFQEADRGQENPVAIVNETLAQRLFGTTDGVGKRFRQRSGPLVEVVGVAEDGKYSTLTEDPRSVVFWPALQRYTDEMVVLARSTRPENEVAHEIRQLIARLDPALPVHGAGSVTQMIGLAYLPSQAAVWALGAFGALALMLACTGVYGLTSFIVSRRVRELGIRRAIGAQSLQILHAVFSRTGAVIAAGAAIGLSLAIGVSGLLASMVHGASATDPAVLATAGMLLGAVGAVSAIGPARRALSVEPIQALKQD